MNREFRVGVVGAGVFAGYHAGKVSAHPGARLSGIVDRDPERARNLGETQGVGAFETVAALAENSDALIIAISATGHAEAALAGLDRGCHLLVEKPLANSVSDAQAIVGRAQEKNLVLQVGHQERLVLNAIGLSDLSDRPNRVEIIRHTGRATRNLDTNVVMDLMIHDLDLVLSLYGDPDRVETIRQDKLYSDHVDWACAVLDYGPMTVQLSASRAAENERRWVLHYDSGSVEIDFGRKTLTHDTPFALDADFGERETVQDSLAGAFECFVSACLDGTPPLASGQDGLAAVKLAASILGEEQ